jgi:hypothetical protein
MAEGDKPTTSEMTKKGEGRRLRFEHEGRLIYEWEQNLDEVQIYIKPPADLPAKMIEIEISHQHLKVGIKGQVDGKVLCVGYYALLLPHDDDGDDDD